MTRYPVVSGSFKTSFQVFKDALDAAKLETGFPRWINACFAKDEGEKKVYDDLKELCEDASARRKSCDYEQILRDS